MIIDAEGRGSDARVQVNFRDAGVKWLALDYALPEAALKSGMSQYELLTSLGARFDRIWTN